MTIPDEHSGITNRLSALGDGMDDGRFRGLVEAGADAVLVVGRDGVVAYANPAAGELMGRPRHELIGHPFGIPIVPNKPAEVDVWRPDGTVRVAEMRAVEVAWRGGTAYHASLRDISERKRAEEALAEADRRKDEFLAMLAHELRNPLAPVRNAMQLLALKSDSPETVGRVRDVIERQVGHLARLVDDLLDVSRIARGKITLRRERIDLVAVVRHAAEDRHPALAQKQLTLDLDLRPTPLWVMADPVRIAQVLDNLLENARKFTDPHGRITVAVTADHCHATVSVRDTGIGIDREVLPLVFDAFAQADRSLDRTPGGLGLGLAIVKGLVELHGGTVRADSAGTGRGAEFIVTLPLAEPPAERDGKPDHDGCLDAGKRLRVLVVDDNRDAADTFQQLLGLMGHDVATAYTGPEAVEAAGRFVPDVVVCDIGLPGMNGYGVAAALRANPATARARLIALTGYGRVEDCEKALAAGFDEHLVKPVHVQTLLATLSR